MSENIKTTEKNEITKKQAAIRIVVFLVVAGLMFVGLNGIFGISETDLNKQSFNALYAEKSNTVDAVYFGTSGTNRYFINPLGYKETGATIYSVATMAMPMFFVPDLMEEIEKTQDPELYIIELRWFIKEKEDLQDAHIRRVTDSMRMSGNRNDAINLALDKVSGIEDADFSENTVDYYVPIIKYHSRLASEDMNGYDFSPVMVKNQTKGYILSVSTVKQVNQFPAMYTDERRKLSKLSQETLDDMLDYCDEKDQEFLFVVSPYSVKEKDMAKINSAIDQVESRGYDVVNYNTPEMIDEIGLDWDHDFYNSKHVNYLGAEKFTKNLAKYIESNYNLPDHRGDSAYSSWDESYKTYENYVKDGMKIIGHKDVRGGEITYTKRPPEMDEE